MDDPPAKEPRQGVLGYFKRLRSWQLLVLAVGLFVADLVIPDPVPFVDEALLGVIALLLARWKKKRPSA